MQTDTDAVLIAVSADGALRVRRAHTTLVVRDAATRHNTAALATQALGRALTCAALMPMSFKDHDRVSLQWVGGGPLRSIMAELRAPGLLRGFVREPQAALWAGDPVTGRIGRGLLPGGLVRVLYQQPDGQFTQAQTELQDGEIHTDLQHYFAQSEQVATEVLTAVRLNPVDTGAVHVDVAGGLLLQALPGTPDEVFHTAAQAMQHLDLFAHTDSALLDLILGPGHRILETLPLRLACPCTRERALGGIALLPHDDVIDMIVKDHGGEVRCEFCATVYRFSPEELLALVETKGGDA